MSVNKKNYKIVEVKYKYATKYVVKKKVFWFFWKSIRNASGYVREYDLKRAAQAYINFLK
jgi:hypothetical protein